MAESWIWNRYLWLLNRFDVHTYVFPKVQTGPHYARAKVCAHEQNLEEMKSPTTELNVVLSQNFFEENRKNRKSRKKTVNTDFIIFNPKKISNGE